MVKRYLLVLEGHDPWSNSLTVERIGTSFTAWEEVVKSCAALRSRRIFNNFLIIESESPEALDRAFGRMRRGESLEEVLSADPALLVAIRTNAVPQLTPDEVRAGVSTTSTKEQTYTPTEAERKRFEFVKLMIERGVYSEDLEREVAD